MKVMDRFNVSKPPEGPRKFSFEFSGPGLISVVVVGILGVVWVFILGVLVGRGYKPEDHVPQVAQIMPAQPPAAQAESKDPPTVLKPEQLEFQDTLQGRKPPETVIVDSSSKPAGDKPTDKAAPETLAGSGEPAVSMAVANSTLATTPALPKGKVATAPAAPDKKAPRIDPVPDKAPAKDAQKEPDKKAKDASKDPKEKKFKASYQVAAFDSKEQAQAEAERFARKGLSTSVREAQVKGKTMYRVMAQVTGTKAEMQQTLEKAGAKKPILRDKKSL